MYLYAVRILACQNRLLDNTFPDNPVSLRIFASWPNGNSLVVYAREISGRLPRKCFAG